MFKRIEGLRRMGHVPRTKAWKVGFNGNAPIVTGCGKFKYAIEEVDYCGFSMS